jgi:hypothetical protein
MDLLRRETGRAVKSPRWNKICWWLLLIVAGACVVGGGFCVGTLALGHRTSGVVRSCRQFANNGQVYDANKSDNTTCTVSLDASHRLVDVTTSGRLRPGSPVRLVDSLIGPQQISNITDGTAALGVGAGVLVLLWWLGYPSVLLGRVNWLGLRRRPRLS